MFCKNCGKEIDDNAAVCIHCGHATANAAVAETKEKRPISVISLCAFILSLIGLFLPTLYGLIAEAVVLVLSIVGVVFASKKKLRLKGLGIASIVISAIVVVSFAILLLGVAAA